MKKPVYFFIISISLLGFIYFLNFKLNFREGLDPGYQGQRSEDDKKPDILSFMNIPGLKTWFPDKPNSSS